MAEIGDDVYAQIGDNVLKQMEGSPFGGSAGDALNEFLKGLSAFGAEFSRIADTLIQFFQATKMFLQAFKNPLTAALIETIDALIEALEELDALGFGSVSVWPWQHGTYPPALNTDKLDEAVLGLVAALQGMDAQNLGFSERGSFVKTKNGESLLTPDQRLVLPRYDTQLTKRFLYDTLNGIRNFFHPELWKGASVFYSDTADAAAKRKAGWHPGMGVAQDDPYFSQSLTGVVLEGAKDALYTSIKTTQDKLLVKELTPQDCVNKIIASLSGTSPDGNKPTGSGPYKALMIMFTLPTINDVIQIVQSFVDYFGSVIGDELFNSLARGKVKMDDVKTTISLGEPLWKPSGVGQAMAVAGLKTDYGKGLFVPEKSVWNKMTASPEEWFYELADFKPKIKS